MIAQCKLQASHRVGLKTIQERFPGIPNLQFVKHNNCPNTSGLKSMDCTAGFRSTNMIQWFGRMNNSRGCSGLSQKEDQLVLRRHPPEQNGQHLSFLGGGGLGRVFPCQALRI